MKKPTLENFLLLLFLPVSAWLFNFIISSYQVNAEVLNIRSEILEIKSDVKELRMYFLGGKK